MKEIRTKKTANPKVLDKAEGLRRRMKDSLLKMRPDGNDTRDLPNTPENYATDKVADSASRIAKEGTGAAKRTTGRMIRKGRQAWKQRKGTSDDQTDEKRTGEQAGRENAERTEQSTGRYSRQARNVRHKAKEGQKKANAVRQRTKGGIRSVDKSIQMAQRSVNATKQTIRTSAKATKSTARTAKMGMKTARMSAKVARAAARAAVKGIKLFVKAVTTAIKATAAAIKSLIAIIAAGGWIVLLVVIVVGVILLILNSAFGIFYSNEDTGDEGTISMSEAVSEISGDYSTYVDQQISNASEGHENVTVEYDGGIDGDSDSINNWVDVLGVYAVKTTMDASEPSEVATVTEEKKQALKDIYWDMNSVSVGVTTETVEETDDEEDETAETVEKTTVHVSISSEDYLDAAERYGFSEEQNEMLNELMASENRYLFIELIGIDCYDDLTSQDIAEIRSSLPNNIGGDIVRYALTRLGDPYSMSKRGTGSYVDCSYLARWAYQQAGVTSYTAATAAEQARYCVNNDMLISKNELQPGDVIFWRKNGCNCGRYKEIHHVAIYIGNGKIIEASSSAGCVRINNLWGEGSGGKWEVVLYARGY